MSSRVPTLYSNSALLLAPEVKLSKMAFMALEDIAWGAAFSGHWSSFFSSKTSKIILSPGITGNASSTFLASSSESHSSLILLKASAIVLFLPFWYLREKSYFTSSFILLCFMASMLGEVRKYVRGLLSVWTLKQ